MALLQVKVVMLQLVTCVNRKLSKISTMIHFQIFNRPTEIYNVNRPGGSGVDSIILGQISQPAENVDRFFSKQVTSHLFTEHPPNGQGTDLPSISTQRGRDHGLPS